MLLQTAALVLVSTFGFALGVYLQCLAMQAVLAIMATVLLVVKPYKCAAANTMAVASMYVLLATTYSALTFLPYNSSLDVSPVFTNIVGSLMLLANIVLLLVVVWKLCKAVAWQDIFASLTLPTWWCGGRSVGGGGRNRNAVSQRRRRRGKGSTHARKLQLVSSWFVGARNKPAAGAPAVAGTSGSTTAV